jgi:hypothetical protein
VAFNKVIDQFSLRTSFTLNHGVTGTATYDPATRTATFTPSAPLQQETTYTATLSTGLLDQAGNALGAPYSWSFTTAGSLNSQYTAGGTYTYSSGTGPNFACDGPALGTKTETVQTLTATTMTWQNNPLAWIRLNGIAGDITGTWRATDPVTGKFYTRTFYANGTFTNTVSMFQCGASGPVLSVTIAGGGNVNSDTGTPGVHGTVPGTYTSEYAWIAPVVLSATTHNGWNFTGWTGDCIPSLLTCSLVMDAPIKNVTATFTVQPNIKIGSTYYGTVQSAFDSASNGDELRLQGLPMIFTETPVFNSPAVTATMKGGWDSLFSNNPGATLVSGGLKVRGGRLNVQRITVRH